MGEDTKDLIKVIAMVILGAVLLMWILGFGSYFFTVNVQEANIITVLCGNEQIYHGKKAFVTIESGGMTTTVTIYKKLFPLPVIDRIYSDKNITVE